MATVSYGPSGGRNPLPQGPVNGIQLLGTQELVAALAQFGEKAAAMLGMALNEEANIIMTDAKDRTPWDTGNLRASGHVKTPELSGSKVSVEFGFGGDAGIGNIGGVSNTGDVNYAIYVHEMTWLNHPHGEAKFLENAVLARAPDMEKNIAAILKDEFERGGHKPPPASPSPSPRQGPKTPPAKNLTTHQITRMQLGLDINPQGRIPRSGKYY